MQEILDRLAAAGFRCLPLENLRGHFVFERGGYVALVEKTESGFGSVGNPGILTENGFAVLVRKDGGFAFVSKETSVKASPEQVRQAREFTAELRRALPV
jgi:hypothetical protein